MNNLDFIKNLLTSNLKGGFITILHREISDDSPFDFLSRTKIATYLHAIIKSDNGSYYFPDILSDLSVNDGVLDSFRYISLDESLNNSSLYITEKEIVSYKAKKHKDEELLDTNKITQDNVKILIDTINEILNNSSLSMLYLKDKLLDGYAHLKIKYFKDDILPVYFMHIKGIEIKDLYLLNDSIDVLEEQNLKDIYKKYFIKNI